MKFRDLIYEVWGIKTDPIILGMVAKPFYVALSRGIKELIVEKIDFVVLCEYFVPLGYFDKDNTILGIKLKIK